MARNPIQQLAEMVGMYAYLAAIGGLDYLPAVQRNTVEDLKRPAAGKSPALDPLGSAPPSREEVPTA